MEEVKRFKAEKKGSEFSRYKNLDRIRYDNGIEVQETMDPVTIKRSTSDQFFEVTPEYQSRLDLISFKFYNTPRLWWVIAYASNIGDPFNVPVGTRLRIPPYSVAISSEVV